MLKCSRQLDVTLATRIVRWQLIIFGWHILSFYKMVYSHHDIPLTCTNWWAFIGQDIGFGIQLPSR